ncbi:MAG: CDP-diacylglycerol--glycerol-3-phosphate 3-phosphatidyltransferase [Bacillota bacterium]|nr:CDP-diacylglycerol--glycerol-3-phosphate 3-phosphatidyltransferase [Bacillota bacterium]
MNLPNKITILRIFLVPVFLIFVMPIPEWVIQSSIFSFAKIQLEQLNTFIMDYGNYIAASVFIIAASTDCLDGYIARKRQLVTRLGKFLDPIADKLLVTAALVALVQRGYVWGWVAFIIIAREFIVTGLRLIAAGEGIVISASIWGKVKTITQMVAILAALLKNYPIATFTDLKIDSIIMFGAVIVTIYSGYDYIAKNKNVLIPDSGKVNTHDKTAGKVHFQEKTQKNIVA